MSVFHGNVGKVRHDQIESFIEILEQIPFPKCDSVAEAKPGWILACERQRVARNIHGENLRSRELLCQTQGNNSASRSNIQNSFRYPVSAFRNQNLDELFGLRPWHHRPLVDRERLSAKLGRAQQMLQRLALPALLHQFAERRQLLFGELALEF